MSACVGTSNTTSTPSATATSVGVPTDSSASASSAPESTAAPATTDSTAAPTTTEVAAAEVIVTDGELFDEARNRRIPYRMYTSSISSGSTPVVLVSHGGMGSETGWTRGAHLGTAFAERGFVAVHVGHLPSPTPGGQLTDRPADVSFVLDRFADGTIEPPAGITADLDRVGHTGHSYGAYTSHAVGGATYASTYVDDRIGAIAPISPQGAGQFGAFDNGGTDTTWHTVDIPAYNLVGGAEVDSNAIGTIDEPGWRLTPFERYPGTRDTFLTVVDGLDHQDMWNSGSDDVEQFIAQAIADFFSVYVAASPNVDPCTIGEPVAAVPAETTRRPGSVDSRLDGCG
jgi:pimeloyl-ACP methyl ester carboxylesterase